MSTGPRIALPPRMPARRAANVVALVALATSCRSLPAGPPPPDAEAIVEGFAPPTVHTDTVDAPFTVALDRSHVRAREQKGQPADFWGSVAVLDVAGARRRPSGWR